MSLRISITILAYVVPYTTNFYPSIGSNTENSLKITLTFSLFVDSVVDRPTVAAIVYFVYVDYSNE